MDVMQIETHEIGEVAENEEPVPATIVESAEAEVFPVQADVEGDGVEAANEGQQTQPVEQVAQSEQPAPKKAKVDKRPYIPWLSSMLEVPQDRKILLKSILEQWPTVSKGGTQTFLTDMINPRYSYFKERPVVKLADGRVCFADKAPAPVTQETAPTTDEPTEQLPE